MHCPLRNIVRLSLFRHLHQCNLCSTQPGGNNLHYTFECSHLRAMSAEFSDLFQDAEGFMRLLVATDPLRCSQSANGLIMNITPSSSAGAG